MIRTTMQYLADAIVLNEPNKISTEAEGWYGNTSRISVVIILGQTVMHRIGSLTMTIGRFNLDNSVI